MRKRLVGATVAVTAGLALSGCAAGGAPGGAPQQTTGGGSQAGSRPVEASAGQQQETTGKASGPGSNSGGNGTGDRPCEASDLDAKFVTAENYDGRPSSGLFSVTKNSDNMTPCVLDGYPEIKAMRGSEGGATMPVEIRQVTADGAQPMRLDGQGGFASFNITWTTSGDDGGCDMPGALAVRLPQAGAQDIEVPVNRGRDNSMRICENDELQVQPFGDYTN
ncbi:tRNA pseudouridine55 synthase [Saccharopolyspora shandongensis]|uniref:tRNA pseudouridine55 synthase n=2 Tax=Saccharopolyspora shandongensis TaxID=418495 RepID=A0A1H2U4R7_9PSEU|nr:tRNA pseudouridine55 synthase [Saccharopolyspora shandongensis]